MTYGCVNSYLPLLNTPPLLCSTCPSDPNVVIRVTVLDNIDSIHLALNLYYAEVRSQKTIIRISDFSVILAEDSC